MSVIIKSYLYLKWTINRYDGGGAKCKEEGRKSDLDKLGNKDPQKS